MLAIHRFTSPFCLSGLVLCLVAACRIDGHYDPLPIDAAPDDGAPSQAKFDVAYVNAWEVGSAATLFTDGAWARIVNTGPEPLDLSLAEITNIATDDERIEIAMTLENVDGLRLNPGFGLGYLDNQSRSLIVSSGLVTEPEQRSGTTLGVIRFTAIDLPAYWFVFKTVGTLKIGSAYANIEFKVIHGGTGSMLIPQEAKRLMSSPL